MLHGDYHVKNVMLQNGEALLIDMDTLCMGHPIFEFASIYLAYQGYGELNPEGLTKFLGIPVAACGEFLKKTFAYYFDTEDEARLTEIMDKARVIGYTRMMRRTIRRSGDTPEGQALIAHCAKQLSELLAKVDSLVI